jgi:hypothetical protein
MGESTLSGYLKIKGLTSEFPELTVSCGGIDIVIHERKEELMTRFNFRLFLKLK